MSREIRHLYEFDSFRLDPAERLLLHDGQPVPLTPKVFETLVVLVERSGHLVEKEELLNLVWAEAFVEEANLARCVHTLRKALCEDHNGHKYIETVPKRGYRFVAEVREVENGGDAEASRRHGQRQIEPRAKSKFLNAFKQNKRVAVFIAASLVIVAIAVFAWSRFANNSRQTNAVAALPKSDITFKRLTPDIYARSPVISPDGKYLAYTQIENNKHSIWRKDIATGGATQLLPPIDADKGYAVLHFSPDGTQLYYHSPRPNVPNWTIFRLTLANGERQAIAEDDISPTAISPDGKQLVFINGKADLMIMGADGSGKRVLRNRDEGKAFIAWGSQMSWSPDGTRIAVCGRHIENGRNNGDLIEVSVSDGSERRIATPSAWSAIDDVAWLADGESLLVTARQTEAEPFQIWRVSYREGTATRITNDNHDYNWISLSADSRLLVAEQGLGHFNIWTAPLSDTKNIKQLTFGNSASDGYYGIAFLPDGGLVYSSMRSGSVDLWMMNADGSNQKQLTVNAGSLNSGQKITPDGRYIVFVSTRTGLSHIWRMDADGGNPKQLTDGVFNAGRVSLSPDGNWIYYNVDNGTASIWKVPLEGGEPIQVSGKASDLSPSVSPDGKLIAYIHHEAGAAKPWRVAVMSAENGESLKAFDFPTARSLLVWTVDSKSLISMGDDWRNLWEHQLDGSPPRQLTDFPSDQTSFFAVSPDHQQIAFSRGNSFSEAVLIDNLK